MPLIFAYGSNLDWDQARARCPSATVVQAAALVDYRLAFVGYSRQWRGAVATVIPAEGKLVAGMIYSISKRDLRALDGFEGAPRHYKREPCFVQTMDGEFKLEVDAYFLDRQFGKPSSEYVATIRKGFRRWGFDPKWLKNAVRFSTRRAQIGGDSERALIEEWIREARRTGITDVGALLSRAKKDAGGFYV